MQGVRAGKLLALSQRLEYRPQLLHELFGYRRQPKVGRRSKEVRTDYRIRGKLNLVYNVHSANRFFFSNFVRFISRLLLVQTETQRNRFKDFIAGETG